MAKGRMINKKISYNEKVAELSLEAKLLFTWCIPHADVKGRIRTSPEIIKGLIVPFVKELNLEKIKSCLLEISEAGLIILYGDSLQYGQFLNFENNQFGLREDRESKSEIPSPDLLRSNSGACPDLLGPKAKVKVKVKVKSKVKVNKETSQKSLYKEFVYLSKEEYEKLINQFGSLETEDWISRLNDYIGSTGRSYKSHYHTIMTWSRKNKDSFRPRPTQAQINSMATLSAVNSEAEVVEVAHE